MKFMTKKQMNEIKIGFIHDHTVQQEICKLQASYRGTNCFGIKPLV